MKRQILKQYYASAKQTAVIIVILLQLHRLLPFVYSGVNFAEKFLR